MINLVRLRAYSLSALALAAACGLLGGCGSDRDESTSRAPSDVPTRAPDSVAGIPSATFRTLKQTSFIRSWDLDLGSKVLTSWISPNVPDLIFFQTAKDNSISAVDTMSGATRWVSAPLPRPLKLEPYVSRVELRNQDGKSYNDDRLYVVDDDILFCFDLQSGQVIWRYELPFSASSGPLAVGSGGDLRVYIGDWQGRVRVVTLQPEGQFPYEAWQWNVESDFSASPMQRESLVYIGDHKGVMHCFALDREEKWNFSAGGLINGSAVARDRVLYFGNTDNVIFAINRLTGEKYGQLNLNGPINRAPFFFNGESTRLYAWVDAKQAAVAGLYALRAIPDTITFADNSQEKPHPPLEIVRMAEDWRYPGVNRQVGSTPQHLFATYRDSTVILAIRRDNGELDWAWDCTEERGAHHSAVSMTQYQDPTDLNRSIYTYDESGKVIVYRFFGYVPGSADAVALQVAKDKAAALSAQAPAAAGAPAAAPAAGDAGAAPAPAAAPADGSAPAATPPADSSTGK